jgi:AcrR family transcriptional regulator
MLLDKIDKRGVLLEVAERLFSEYGYEGVSTRMIAAEADANVAMIAYYFGSKEKLYGELLSSRIPKVGEKLLSLRDEVGLSAWERISGTIDVYVSEIFSRKYHNKIIMREMSQSQRPETVKAIIENVYANWSIINGFIVDGQEKGVFRYVDNQLTIATFIGTILNVVNNPLLLTRLMGEADEEYVFSMQMQIRLGVHLKECIRRHLMV